MRRCLAISSHQVCLKHAMEMFKYGPWAENRNCVVVKGAFSLLRLTHHPCKHIKFRHPHIQQSAQATMDIALPPIALAPSPLLLLSWVPIIAPLDHLTGTLTHDPFLASHTHLVDINALQSTLHNPPVPLLGALQPTLYVIEDSLGILTLIHGVALLVQCLSPLPLTIHCLQLTLPHS